MTNNIGLLYFGLGNLDDGQWRASCQAHHAIGSFRCRMIEVTKFDKYDALGAYHWQECDRRYSNWKRYNPALAARYELTVRRIASLRQRREVLDIGCGDGYLMAQMAPIGERVIGVDSEANAIRLAEGKLRNFSNCELIHTTCYDLPFEEKSFDVVTSADVIEHLKNPEHHLKEICRVLRDSGCLVLTTPQWRPDCKWDERHEIEYRPEELCQLLQQYFASVSLSYFWPKKWSRIYETRIGWRLLKLLAIQIHNPFLRSSCTEPGKFTQTMAVCQLPIATKCVAQSAAS